MPIMRGPDRLKPGSTNSVCIEDCAFWFTSAVKHAAKRVSAWPQELVYHTWAQGRSSGFARLMQQVYTADSENFIDATVTKTIIPARRSIFAERY